MNKLIIIFLFIYGCSQNLVLGQWVVNTSVDSNLYWVGDPILVNLQIFDDRYEITEIKTDTIFKADPAIEVINFDKWDKDPTNSTWSTKLTVGVYDSGVYKLPEFHILVKTPHSLDTLYSMPVELTVRTLPVSDTSSIAPIKNIIRTPASLKDYLPWVIGVLAFLAILISVIYFIRKKGKASAIPPMLMTPIAAYDLAYTKLNRLKEIRLWEKAKEMEYQIELTHIIRTYICNRYQLPAMELSTKEILNAVRSRIVAPEAYNYLGNLLEVGDYVKFAKGIPPGEVHEHVMQMAFSFIEKTKA